MDESCIILNTQRLNIKLNSSTAPHIYDEITAKNCGNMASKENTVGT